jgi:hypothetical protein
MKIAGISIIILYIIFNKANNFKEYIKLLAFNKN